MDNPRSLPTYFISHGGGPWPWLKREMPGVYDKHEASLADIPQQLRVPPEAVLVISGHWEERDFTVMSAPRPPMVYDYSGSPDFTYSIQYPAEGSPELAKRIEALLSGAGLPVSSDDRRGYDHGTFAPLAAMYPRADVPVLQLSIRADYDVEAHLAAGRALAPLRAEGVLIVASGLSYHNLRRFGTSGQQASREFDGWLTAALCSSLGEQRNQQLRQWTSAPSARVAHPDEDHLIPLMVAVGAAEGEAARRVYHEDSFFGALTVSSYGFGTDDRYSLIAKEETHG